MTRLAAISPARRMTRDGVLLCLSAFFADLGYQGVAALYPLYLVFVLHAPVYWYGAVTAIAFGAGALVSYLGGLAGDRFDRKRIAIIGNCFIPLMALCGLTHVAWLSGLLFILGWWARYFRSPPRRALLVQVTAPGERGFAFGFLHALDIAGGMLSALAALLSIALGWPIGLIMLGAIAPLAVSTGLLFFVRRTQLYPETTSLAQRGEAGVAGARADRTLLVCLLAGAVLYGFSFYNLGFPILTASGGRATTSGYELGVLAYVVYLAVSAASGYLLGALKASPLRSLWLLGYLPSALGSGLVGLSVLLHMNALAFYLFIAVLGAGMGAVETFEPTLISSLVGAPTLSRGMGFLSVARAVGQFVSNLVMGVLFSLSRSVPYFYAFASAMAAAAVLGFAEVRYSSAARAPARQDRPGA